ncbi:MAG: ergothioneine biosynthesis protein EgtB [Pseudoxanthomonas sp.]
MPASPAPVAAAPADTQDPRVLAQRFSAVRARSVALAAPLSAEDAMVQSMEDASPSKWHLAHSTWFFERFVLAAQPGYVAVDAQWDFLFNSYYQTVGPMHARPRRGVVSRPSLAQVLDYRAEVDARIARRLDAGDLEQAVAQVLLMGTHHEQQHQELLLTDIKHAFWYNPLHPAYRDDLIHHRASSPSSVRWIARDEGIIEMGASPWPQAAAFAFDNEAPRHRVLVAAHALASRPVSNGEYLAFVDDGGYDNVALWMSEGWERLQAQAQRRPLYWHAHEPREFTLAGWRELDPHAPVCHVSQFEADAFARWAGARLPTEAEWEQAAAGAALEGNFVESDALHPQALAGSASTGLQQLFGDVWEWTSTAYTPYPGFRPLPGSLGEYNGKFMSGQCVLRGGSCVTPRDHVRASYRNFFPPPTRWQFSGIRLAKDAT